MAGSIRCAHTYSVVAHDAKARELGVAVQSHYFAVGPDVPWAEAGVGAVATQAFVDVGYGPRGLELMRRGVSAPEALARLVARDKLRNERQVAMVDGRGRVAVHTGARCIADAGHHTGKGWSVQANMMVNASVVPAMALAFERARGDLADRFLETLEAAERAGGDIRGRQSAAILVVRGRRTASPWRARVFDLRVEDDREPLEELRRLVSLRRAYLALDASDDAFRRKDVRGGARNLDRAVALGGENPEFAFWGAVALAKQGRVDRAIPMLRRIFRQDARWEELLRRLPNAGIAKSELVARLLHRSDARP